jgi:ribosomal protein L16 Arg81 hydroxylase
LWQGLDNAFVVRYRAYGLTIESVFTLPVFVPETGDGAPDVRVVRGRIEPPPMAPTAIRRAGLEAEFGRTDEASFIRWPGAGTLRAARGEELLVEPAEGVDEMFLARFIVSEAFGLLLIQRGLFLLHASAVAIGGEAAIFLAPAGVGKSTLAAACAQRGHTVLADDMVAVDFPEHGERPVVLPGAPQISAWPETIRGLGQDPSAFPRIAPDVEKRVFHRPAGIDLTPVPLRGIFFTKAGKTVQRASIPLRAIDLTRFFPVPPDVLTADGRRLHFRQCQQLCACTPAWRIQRAGDFGEIWDSVAFIEGNCRSRDSASRRREHSFAKLIAPVGVEEFFDEYFERQPLHLKARDVRRYADILTEQDIDLFFQNHQIPASTLRVFALRDELPRADFSLPGTSGLADTAKLLRLYGEGKTITINGADRSIPSLVSYRGAMERELGCGLQFNLYLTPQKAQGLPAHYDDHDVFILQISGRKSWSLFAPPVELPSTRQRHRDGAYELGEPLLRCELVPGDLIYIPRGTPHAATTDDSSSIHITFGLHPVYAFDLVSELGTMAQDRPEFRRAVPSRLASEARKQEFKRTFEQLCGSLIRELAVDELFSRRTRASEQMRERFSDNRGRFSDLSRLADITLDTVLARRPSSSYTLESEDDTVALYGAGKKVLFPKFARRSVQSILDAGAFPVREIGGLISDEGRLELARTLLREGLLEVEALRPASRTLSSSATRSAES